MAGEITTEQSQADLARAGDVAGRVRRRAQWMWVYLAAFAAGFGGITLILGPVLYTAALLVGDPSQLGRLTYLLPAAVLVAVPLAVAAWRERRA